MSRGFAIRRSTPKIWSSSVSTISGSLVINSSVQPPSWGVVPTLTINAGTSGSYTLPVTGLVGNVSWKSPGSKPNWLSFSGNVMSWTSAVTQTDDISNVVLTASNPSGPSDSQPFNIVVPNLDNAPVWGTLSPSFVFGSSSSYVLPVSDPENDPITITGSLPSGFSISGVTLVYNGSAAIGSYSGLQLTATANGKSTPSSTFTIIVQASPAATAELWGSTYRYLDNIWKLYRRDNVTQITSSDVPGIHQNARFNTGYAFLKDNDAVYRPATQRIYVGYGDSELWNLSLDGFSTTLGYQSNNPVLCSFNIATPTSTTREAGKPLPLDEMYGQMDDQQSLMHDSVNDRLLWFTNSTFGTEFDNDPDLDMYPVDYINETHCVLRSTGSYRIKVGMRIKFTISVSGTWTPKLGVVAAVTPLVGDTCQVTMTWLAG